MTKGLITKGLNDKQPNDKKGLYVTKGLICISFFINQIFFKNSGWFIYHIG